VICDAEGKPIEVNGYWTDVKKLGASADEKLIEILGIIEKDVGYADRIMNDLLEYSGEFGLELLEANLRSIIEEALALVSIPSSIRVRNLAND